MPRHTQILIELQPILLGGKQRNALMEKDRMDAGLPPVKEEPAARDWSLLPLDALASIFNRLTKVHVLTGAGLVCRSWLQGAKLPDVWRVVCFNYGYYTSYVVTAAMLKAAVDRSDGQLRVLDLYGEELLTDELMQYILERSPSLTTLKLLSCIDVFSERVLSAIRKSPLLKLRCLKLEDCDLNMEELTAVLENCPALKVLWVVNCIFFYRDDVHELQEKFPRIKTIKIEREDSDYGSSSEGMR